MEKTGEQIVLEEISSDADFVLYCERRGVLSEHCTAGEARMSFYEEAARFGLGEHLPRIYQRDDAQWVLLS
jgi:hypothetical protein